MKRKNKIHLQQALLDPLKIVVPLTARDMSCRCLPKTVTRMDAGAEPPGMVLRRVLCGHLQLMSRTG